MTELVVLVPVLNRPQNVEPLLHSIAAATPGDPRILFICDPDDRDEIDAVGAAGAEILIHAGNYASKINRGVVCSQEPLIFLGADDLDFRPGWLEAAKVKLDPAQVVGVNDLIPRQRDHQTHFLITREYAEQGCIDGPGVLCELYAHNCVDDELMATAKRRGVYAYAPDAQVRHDHPMVGASIDSTYVKGMAPLRADRRIFRTREALWTS